MRTKLWTLLLLVAVTTSAYPQLRLPGVTVPRQPLSQTLTQTVDQTSATTWGALSDARRGVLERLIRSNRQLIDSDPHGEPVIRNEILVLSPSATAMEHARATGFSIVREQALDVAGVHVLILQAPGNLSTRQALKLLRAADPLGTYDYNHIYSGAGAPYDPPPDDARRAVARTGTAPSDSALRVGLLDTGVDSTHPVFHGTVFHAWGCAGKPLAAAHGTAVASLLVTPASTEIFAADVYCGLPTGGAVDAIIGALAWMVDEHVAVINVSLVGPKNLLLERTVAALAARGHLIVAAVGNDGPTAPPLYPAAYPNVVGVTGVDASRRVLLEAVRGPQVMFAAPGAGVDAANAEHGVSPVRGTSFAAPSVARLLAALLTTPDKSSADAAIDTLAHQAIDLGAPGKDLTYGYGLVGTN